MKYEQINNNEWVTPVRKNYKMICCDCGLVHDADFRTKGRQIQFKVTKNNRSTALTRRKR
jgi:hypothetical protein